MKGDVTGVKNDCGIRVIKGMNKRTVMIVTCKPEQHDGFITKGREIKSSENVQKPPAISDYNQAKKGVDVSN